MTKLLSSIHRPKLSQEAVVVSTVLLLWGLFFGFLPEIEVWFMRFFKFIDY